MNKWNLAPETKWSKVRNAIKNVLATLFIAAVAYAIVVMTLCM